MENSERIQQQELPKKQKFQNLDDVLDESKYTEAPNQRKRKFKNSDAKKTMEIKSKTFQDKTIFVQRGAANIMKHAPDPRGMAKNAKTPLECFDLIFTTEIIEKIVEYNNGSIQLVLDQFFDAIKATSRNTYFCLVDQINIKAFLGILYLRAVLGLNIRNTSDIWTHESPQDIIAATIVLK